MRNLFVAIDGKPTNAGTEASPFDLPSVLSGSNKPIAGDTVWIAGGVYKGGVHKLYFSGTATKPIHIRAKKGERVVFQDLSLIVNASYLWLWDLEITKSLSIEERRKLMDTRMPSNLDSGIEIYGKKGCKFINLSLHDNLLHGMGLWTDAIDAEVYGCLIYNNGSGGGNRRNCGHCIYTQNNLGIKKIDNCIMSVPEWGGYMSMHAFGTEAPVNNYLIQNNIAHSELPDPKGRFQICGHQPSQNIRVLRNCLYGCNLQVGFAAQNLDCQVGYNTVIGGVIKIIKFTTVSKPGNIIDPAKAKPVLFPNKYDPGRAHIAGYNPGNASAITVNVLKFMPMGTAYKVVRAFDFWGDPVSVGICGGATIAIPMSKPFEAFVLLKDAA